MLTSQEILNRYPAANRQINFIIKYQDKFNYDINNIKCLNPECNNIRKMGDSKRGLAYCCSEDCQEKVKKEIQNLKKIKSETTNLKKYGVKNPTQNQEIFNKQQETKFKKYGNGYLMNTTKLNTESLLIRYPNQDLKLIAKIIKYQDKFQFNIYNIKCNDTNCNNLKKWRDSVNGLGLFCSEACRLKNLEFYNRIKSEKTKQTNLEKYGCHPNQLPEQKEKVKSERLQRTGYIHQSHDPKIREKIKQTNIERYGSISNFGNHKIRKQIEQTFLKKYGTKNPMQNTDIKLKVQKTNLEKYNTTSNFNQNIINFDKWVNVKFWKDNFISQNKNLNFREVMKFFNCSQPAAHNQIKKLNIDYIKLGGRSIYETEISNHLISIKPNINILQNTRTVIQNKELDIYLPEYNIAIEFNGLYWHSYMNKEGATHENQINKLYNKKRHLEKTEACHKLGIKLLHIFENEWETKQQIWRSVIRNQLGLSEKIYARKCIIKIVNKQEAREFIANNHLQGSETRSTYYYGLYYQDELVSVMSFGKPLYNKNYDYELVRFCNKLNCNVVGGASRLLKAFRNEYPGSIISYANRRWSDGNLYRTLGFTELGASEPAAWYWNPKNPNILINRLHLQKHKLETTLEKYDHNLTADQNIFNNKYRVIYDSGNLCFSLK